MVLQQFLFEHGEAERTSAVFEAGYKFFFTKMTVKEFSCMRVESKVVLDPHGLLSAGVSWLAHYVKILSDWQEMSRKKFKFFRFR